MQGKGPYSTVLYRGEEGKIEKRTISSPCCFSTTGAKCIERDIAADWRLSCGTIYK